MSTAAGRVDRPRRLLVTGSRDWDDTASIEEALALAWARWGQPASAVLVTGGCPTGADRIAEDWWTAQGLQVERHPADWKKHGRAAGPIRNHVMVTLGADLCLAFIKGNSAGASGCAAMAETAGLPVRRIVAPGEDAS